MVCFKFQLVFVVSFFSYLSILEWHVVNLFRAFNLLVYHKITGTIWWNKILSARRCSLFGSMGILMRKRVVNWFLVVLTLSISKENTLMFRLRKKVTGRLGDKLVWSGIPIKLLTWKKIYTKVFLFQIEMGDFFVGGLSTGETSLFFEIRNYLDFWGYIKK